MLLTLNSVRAETDDWTQWALSYQRDQLTIDEPINWVMRLGSHNAFASAAYGYPFADPLYAPNQALSITDQLNHGSRWLELDVYRWINENDDWVPMLCHGPPAPLHTCRSGTDPELREILEEIKTWMESNPGEILILAIEDKLVGNEDPYANLQEPLTDVFGDLIYTINDTESMLQACADGSGRCFRWFLNGGFDSLNECITEVNANASQFYTSEVCYGKERNTIDIKSRINCFTTTGDPFDQKCAEHYFRVPERWPTRREMIAAGKRIVVIDSKNGFDRYDGVNVNPVDNLWLRHKRRKVGGHPVAYNRLISRPSAPIPGEPYTVEVVDDNSDPNFPVPGIYLNAFTVPWSDPGDSADLVLKELTFELVGNPQCGDELFFFPYHFEDIKVRVYRNVGSPDNPLPAPDSDFSLSLDFARANILEFVDKGIVAEVTVTLPTDDQDDWMQIRRGDTYFVGIFRTTDCPLLWVRGNPNNPGTGFQRARQGALLVWEPKTTAEGYGHVVFRADLIDMPKFDVGRYQIDGRVANGAGEDTNGNQIDWDNWGWLDLATPGSCITKEFSDVRYEDTGGQLLSRTVPWRPWAAFPILDPSTIPRFHNLAVSERKQFWIADPLNWTRLREDRHPVLWTLASGADPSAWVGMLSRDTVRRAAGCNVTIIAMDMVGAPAHAHDTACDFAQNGTTEPLPFGSLYLPGPATGHGVWENPDDPCPDVENRFGGAVWTWNQGDFGEHGYALLTGTIEVISNPPGGGGPTAVVHDNFRFTSAPPTEAHPCACAVAPQSHQRDPIHRPDPQGYHWFITTTEHRWSECSNACASINTPSGETLEFSTPVHGPAKYHLAGNFLTGDLPFDTPTPRSVWLNHFRWDGPPGDVPQGLPVVPRRGANSSALLSRPWVRAQNAADVDLDGIPNDADSCIHAYDPVGRDTDNDGYGNACDPDLNNDGTVNFVDLMIFREAFFDSGVGLDADFNGDNLVNFIDLALMRHSFFGPPGPSALVP